MKKVDDNIKNKLMKALKWREELPTNNKGIYIDEQQASASYILCNTLALNLVHGLLNSKAKVNGSCISTGFVVKKKGSVRDLQDYVYNVLQSAGIDCYCSEMSVMIRWIAIDIHSRFISVQCILDEYESCMRWIEVHEIWETNEISFLSKINYKSY